MSCLSECCAISAADFSPAYMRWEDHPSRVDWEVLRDLGAGSFSAVVLARHRRSGEFAALKVIFLDEPGMGPETRAMLQQEGDILLSVRHPHIVRCREVVRSARADVLVLEYLRGGNVLDGLHRMSEKYSERDAAGIFRQLASAVAHLHSKGIIHRDIKPENLVFAEPVSRAAAGSDGGAAAVPVVKLVDLGMALQYNPSTPERVVLGSAGFVAPEVVLGGEHTPAMDVFAMGVMLFILLVGRKPYNTQESEKLRYARIPLAEAPGVKDPRWLDLSPDAKQLVMGMLAFDPARRLTAAQVLAHEWVASVGGSVLRPLGDDVALGAATVAEMRRLRFITGGVVGAQRRAADAATAVKAQRRRGGAEDGSTKGHAAFLQELRRMQKREASVRGGLRGVARSIAAQSFKTVHDAGGSVHRSMLERSVRTGQHDASVHDDAAAAAAAASAAAAKPGMHRSATALMLSEVLMDGSNGGGGRMRRTASTAQLAGEPSALQELGTSIKHYLDVSLHGGRKCSAASRDSSLHSSRAHSSPPEAAQHDGSKGVPGPAEAAGSGAAAIDGQVSSHPLLKVVQVRPASASGSRRSSLDIGGASSARRVHSIRPLE